MKNFLLLLTAIFSFNFSNAQVAVDTTGTLGDSYNRWTIDVYAGQAKGIKPYADGYYSSDPSRSFGGFQVNSFGAAARYMLSPKFGLKMDLNYDKFTNQKGSGSLDFETYQYRVGFQGVVNAVRLFGLEDSVGRFGLLLHGGLQISRMHSDLLDKDELNGGLIVGFSPQFRISNSLSVVGDISLLNNFRQHLSWDGSYADSSENLSGQMIVMTLGLSYSFGNEKIHGDWAIIQDKKDKEIEALNGRIGEIETLMNDSDKDGVPDYLDAENNSLAGVAVDTKGRMVDKNTNGVPDELEKYIDNTITNNNNVALSKNMIEQLINEGYIAAYFDKSNSQPTPASADNIGFVLNYLRNNPTASVEISGYADEVGDSAKNEKLASTRAENVKAILIKAGINPSRLNAKGAGIDSSVDKNSDYARRLVRKAVFKITN
ncbi:MULTISPECIES: OmpA family protein [unclassified Flavobacterium]|uniref:OmpA family protein n=1 Tax=unclassified Flavobacterium TaxID=196869 RepID=UPI000EACD2C8|nr:MULTISPECIES: OmpA family protein [unclassified Flavobacterium]RKS02617.1 OOP family OmpA-OmpF porin [Flavobacterium sp. 102]